MKICQYNHRTAKGDENLGHEEGKVEEGTPKDGSVFIQFSSEVCDGHGDENAAI